MQIKKITYSNLSKPLTKQECNGGYSIDVYNANSIHAFFTKLHLSNKYDWGIPNPHVSFYNPYHVLMNNIEYNLNSNLKPKGSGDIIVLQSKGMHSILKPHGIKINKLALQIVYQIDVIQAKPNSYIKKKSPIYIYKLVSARDSTVKFKYNDERHPNFKDGKRMTKTICSNIYVTLTDN